MLMEGVVDHKEETNNYVRDNGKHDMAGRLGQHPFFRTDASWIPGSIRHIILPAPTVRHIL